MAESEIWPNTVLALERAGVPLVQVNARISARSARGWARTPATARALFARIALCLAQGPEDAARFSALGAPRVAVAGNLKLDAAPPPADPDALARLAGLVAGRPLVLAASTHPGEEEAVLAAHRRLAPRFPGLLTIIVPRHPARGAEIAALAGSLRSARRSEGDLPDGGVDVYVADTLDELGLFYRLAPVALVGGSLAPLGGHNPIEPARLGCAIVHGPRVENFGEAYAALDRCGGAAPVADAADLAGRLRALLDDPAAARAMARAAEAALADLAGGLERTLAALEPYLAPLVARAGPRRGAARPGSRPLRRAERPAHGPRGRPGRAPRDLRRQLHRGRRGQDAGGARAGAGAAGGGQAAGLPHPRLRRAPRGTRAGRPRAPRCGGGRGRGAAARALRSPPRAGRTSW